MTIRIITTDGAVLSADGFYVVDELSEEQEWVLENGSPQEIAETAEKTGVRISKDTMEWVKYGWRTSVSYGPSALKDEAEVILETLHPDDIVDITTRGLIERFLSANEAEMALVGETIMNSDDTWNGYKQNFVDALYEIYGKEPF